MKKILIINGPNLNMLGVREPEIYGSRTYGDLVDYIKDYCNDKCLVDFYQSNHEGGIIDCIQDAYKKYDGIVINAGGYTHTSVAIPDAISTVQIPTAEVHISDITKRESFRHHSFLTDVCSVTIMGKGFEGYTLAIEHLLKGE